MLVGENVTEALRPAAMQILQQDGGDAFDAWRKAILSCKMPELRAIVLRLGTWRGMTTSGVERTHTVQDWLLDGRRVSLTTETESHDIKVSLPQWSGKVKYNSFSWSCEF